MFVADADRCRLDSNIVMWFTLTGANTNFPRNAVVQLNKRDLANAMNDEELRAALKLPLNIPIVETVAIDIQHPGVGRAFALATTLAAEFAT